MKSLGEAIPEEMARCRKIKERYLAIGPAGIFGATMIENTLRKADSAVISGDLTRMIRAYNDLREIKE